MSKIGNHRVEIQETDDYRFGWESADRGEPRPEWAPACARLEAQRLGWDDYTSQESPNGLR